jgi:hypothetical protein
MTNDGEHDASPSLNFPIPTLFPEDDLSAAFHVKVETAMRVRQTQSAFHRRACKQQMAKQREQPAKSKEQSGTTRR